MAQTQKAGPASKRGAPVQGSEHPRSVATIEEEPPREQPFVEGAQDSIDVDLRHRMISEEAYRLYAARGYIDGYDVDDWLQAEASIDHLLTGVDGEV